MESNVVTVITVIAAVCTILGVLPWSALFKFLFEKNDFTKLINGIPDLEDNRSPFHYRNKCMDCIGRESELQILTEFVNTDEPFQWIAVTGSGGVGKSKLVKTFIDSSELGSWKRVWLHSGNVEELADCASYKDRRKIIVVIDYAGVHAEKIGEWFGKMIHSGKYPKKLRVILIERETSDERNNQKINPYWYTRMQDGQNKFVNEDLNRKKFPMDTFSLHVESLSDENNKELIKMYLENYLNTTTPETREQIAKSVLEFCERRPWRKEPLILMMIADYLGNHQLQTGWNESDILKYIMEKNEGEWDVVNTDKLKEPMKHLLLVSTMIGRLEIRKDFADSPISKDVEIIRDKTENDEAKFKRLADIFCQQNTSQGELLALEPDLIGEYFALTELKSIYNMNQNQCLNFIDFAWKKAPAEFVAFLIRTQQDFGTFFDGFNLGKSIFEFFRPSEKLIDQNNVVLLDYCIYLYSFTTSDVQYDFAVAEDAIERLEILYMNYKAKNPEIIVLYAKGLFNLSCEQESEALEATIERLETLYKEHGAENPEIIVVYASGLFNLSNRQESEAAEHTINRLKNLCKEHGIECPCL